MPVVSVTAGIMVWALHY